MKRMTGNIEEVVEGEGVAIDKAWNIIEAEIIMG